VGVVTPSYILGGFMEYKYSKDGKLNFDTVTIENNIVAKLLYTVIEQNEKIIQLLQGEIKKYKCTCGMEFNTSIEKAQHARKCKGDGTNGENKD
jgi:hypothetical protein